MSVLYCWLLYPFPVYLIPLLIFVAYVSRNIKSPPNACFNLDHLSYINFYCQYLEYMTTSFVGKFGVQPRMLLYVEEIFFKLICELALEEVLNLT